MPKSFVDNQTAIDEKAFNYREFHTMAISKIPFIEFMVFENSKIPYFAENS